MKKKFRGRVWKFGHNIDTDIMAPGKYENLPLAELSRHCLEPIDDRFAPEVRKNDVIVAGDNFGCGSAREIAPRALQHLKVGAIIAAGFSRTFFRNAVAIGLPVLISPDALLLCSQGDILTIDLHRSQVWNETRGRAVAVESVPEDIFPILLKGGLFPAMRTAFPQGGSSRKAPGAPRSSRRKKETRQDGGEP